MRGKAGEGKQEIDEASLVGMRGFLGAEALARCSTDRKMEQGVALA